MRKRSLFVCALVVMGITAMPFTAHAESVDLQLQIEGIECDLTAAYEQFGFIPQYCTNQPDPEPSTPTPEPPYESIDEIVTIPVETTPIAQPMLPPPILPPTTSDSITPEDSSARSTVADLTSSTVIAVVTATAVTSATVAIDALYFGGRIGKNILSFITRLLK